MRKRSSLNDPSVTMSTSRRSLLRLAAAAAAASLAGPRSAGAQAMPSSPDLILFNCTVITLDKANPRASAIAVKDGLFQAVGADADILKLAGSGTQRIDLKRRTVMPGLQDNHIHVIRGGLNYNMELRWDGCSSLADAMAMLKAQVQVTPPPQWVRVVGGFTEHQFAEKRLPTLEE